MYLCISHLVYTLSSVGHNPPQREELEESLMSLALFSVRCCIYVVLMAPCGHAKTPNSANVTHVCAVRVQPPTLGEDPHCVILQ